MTKKTMFCHATPLKKVACCCKR